MSKRSSGLSSNQINKMFKNVCEFFACILFIGLVLGGLAIGGLEDKETHIINKANKELLKVNAEREKMDEVRAIWEYEIEENNLADKIEKIAEEEKATYLVSDIKRTIECEAGSDVWDKDRIERMQIRGSYGEIGTAQFLPESWNYLTTKAEMQGASIHNENDQLRVMIRCFKIGLASHWTCY